MSSDAPINPGRALFAPHALLPQGWAHNVLLVWNGEGLLTQVRRDTLPPLEVETANGPLLPGMPNLHSQAHRHALAGLTELRDGGRERIQRLAQAVSPVQLEDLATHLHIEMLKAGYTSVCEFQSLHLDPSHQPYANPAEMSLRVLSAARLAGIGITLLPVLDCTDGFGVQPTTLEPQRGVGRVDALLGIAQRLRGHGARIGVAPHSLRRVPPAALHELLDGLKSFDATAPIHLRIAEREQELHDCIAWSGQRPVQWLLAHADIDARWCLVHATHMDAVEARGVAMSGATVGLCPSSEALRGDGGFDAPGYLGAGGGWGIGSDSQASLAVAAELRLLETHQRVAQRHAPVLTNATHENAAHEHLAEALWLGAVAGGARASGRPIAGLAVGQMADFVMLSRSAALAELSPPQMLASHVFASQGRHAISDVWVAGVRRIQGGSHEFEDAACEAFVAARTQLLARI